MSATTILIGRVGGEPEATKSGKSMQVSVAHTEFKDGEESTVWFRCYADQDAKFLPRLTKGALVQVHGRLVLDKDPEAEGVRYYEPRLFLSNVETILKPRDKSGDAAPARQAGGKGGKSGKGAPDLPF